MESSGVKLQGPNPGSLLRSKSTRRDRRCAAASERLVTYKNSIVYHLCFQMQRVLVNFNKRLAALENGNATAELVATPPFSSDAVRKP